MKHLSKAEILGAKDLCRETVEVPEWGGAVIVTELSEKDTEEFLSGPKTEAALIALCVIDEQGDRLFSDEDIEPLRKKNRRALRRVFNVCMKVNKLSAAAEEENVKKSDPDPGAASTSA